MPRARTSALANRILKRLPSSGRDDVVAAGAFVPLTLRQVLHEGEEPISSVYFVEQGVISLVQHLDDGRIVEVGTIGSEGFLGLPVFWGVGSATSEAFVQVPGRALRIPAARFRPLAAAGSALHDALHRYAQAMFTQIAQSAACNRAHEIEQRCARWILMTHDRVNSDEFTLTQEFLAQMLGVRRAGVSAAASVLQRAGYIKYSRGRMTVRDRRGLESASCECYRVIRDEFDRLLPP